MNNSRPSVRKSRAELTRKIAAFLHGQRQKFAEKINASRARFNKQTQDEQDVIDRIIADLDFAGWTVLVGEVEPIMREIMKDGAYAALAEIHFDTSADPGIGEIVNADALDYARLRSADMVGMRRDELGRLVENPNADWSITEATRDGLRQYVTAAVEQGWSNDKLAAQIADSYAFSNDRAMVIARTETNKASNTGSIRGYQASGVVDGKQWLTAEDDLVSPECEDNGNAGPDGDGVLLNFDDEYPSGDVAPPAHPNCRCTLAPYIATTAEAETAPEETA